MATSLVFPADLASDQQKHFMKIKIFPNPNGSQTTKAAAPTIFLFIPGSDENGSLFWQMAHEYDEVKITKLGAGVIGGVGNMIAPTVTAAASTVAGYAGAGMRLMGKGTINPKVDLLYGNTQLRGFQFDYFMAPQSEAETQTLDKIVRTLRKYSSPEITALPPGFEGATNFLGGNFGSASGQSSQLQSGLWFIPPAEFLVTFHTVQPNAENNAQISEKENPYLPKIGRCVLSRVDVNYTQQGSYSTFKNGSPTSLFLTLVFNEMRVISQADIENGY
jgi:hypothetical protein